MATNTSAIYDSLVAKYGKEKADAAIGAASSSTATKDTVQAAVSPTVAPKETVQPKQETYKYDANTGYYTTPTTSSSSSSNSANIWNNLSYENQQKALTDNPQLKQYLDTKGLTQKSAPVDVSGANQYNVSTRPETAAPTKKETEWDYQSTDDTRIQEMIGNLDYYKRNVPSLFDSWESYSDFFLEGKPRSPEQAKIVEQYYWDYQKYKPYDNYTPEQIGVGLANGTIPSDYLDYLKQYEPMKYGDALNAMNTEKAKIGNNASYEAMVMNAGVGDSRYSDFKGKDESYRDWLAWSGLFQDKDQDGVDDYLYIKPSEEEVSNQSRISELNAEKQRLNDLIDDNLDSLQKQYPGASLQTLRVLNADMNADLYQQLKEIGYEITELTGNRDYLANERKSQASARYQSIQTLQNDLKMYYGYSAQGMSELAQAQYAATNVTLSQADTGTYTQKQMALESVLDGYYQKYGSIIQRSEAQVINDVIAYAKEKGISLSQALQENFITPLQQKSGYGYLNSSVYAPDLQTVGYDSNGKAIQGYWDGEKFVTVSGEGISVSGTGGTNADGTPIFTDADINRDYNETVGNAINNIGHILSSEDGLRIGTYTSKLGYTYNVYADRETGMQATKNLLSRAYYGMSVGDAIQKWIGKGKDVSEAKATAQGVGLNLNDKLSDSNVENFILAMGKREGTIDKGQSLNDWISAGKVYSTEKSAYDENYSDIFTAYSRLNSASIDEKRFRELYGDEINVDKKEFLRQYKNWYTKESKDAYLEILSNLDGLIETTVGDGSGFGYLERANAKMGIGDVGALYDYVVNNLTVNGLQEARDRGLKLGVLSDSDVQMIAKAASALGVTVSDELWAKSLNDFRNSLLNNNPYLKEAYENRSAYSEGTTINYNSSNKKFTFGRSDTPATQEAQTTSKAKNIGDLLK